MKKITILVGSLNPGGAEKTVANLASYLGVKYQVDIITWSNNDSHFEVRNSKHIKLRNYSGKNWIVKNVNSFFGLYKYIMSNRNNCYIVFLPVVTILLLLFRRFINGEIIVTIRNYPPKEYKNWLLKCLNRLLMPMSDGIVFQTEEQKSFFSFMNSVPCAIIPNAISISGSEHSSIINKEKVFIAVGRLDKQKNYLMMIDAVSVVFRKDSRYCLYIYGEGRERNAIEKRIKENEMEERIFLKGITKNISDVLRRSEIFLMTSDYEGISNAMLEAMAEGLPVVCTDSYGGGARSIIKDGENGFLICKGNTIDFCDALLRLTHDDQLRERMGKNAKKSMQKYSDNYIYSKWSQFLEVIFSGDYGTVNN